jgi:hypothetical protein
MPYYPHAKSSQHEKNLLLRVGSHTYRLSVRTSDFSTILFLGGHTTYCIDCIVFLTNPIGRLTIAYNERCSLAYGERGSSIKQLMTALFSYLQKYYPHVTTLEFIDTSSRNCGPRCTVKLSSFHYLLYGKTWFMEHMGAVFASIEDAERFEELNSAFQARKATMSWDEFDDMYVLGVFPLPDETVKELYNAAPTWSVFFQSVRDKVGELSEPDSVEQSLCNVWTNAEHRIQVEHMALWLDYFIHSVAHIFFGSFLFHMPVPALVASFTEEPYRSGRRITMKRLYNENVIM